MILKKLTIINKLGLHARAAAKLVHLTSQYQCDIQVSKNGQAVNAKSIMGVMMLAASSGTVLELMVDGADEQEASNEIIKLVRSRFGEKE